MKDFAGVETDDRLPVSIKVRVHDGCFHREHSPHAYQIIDDYLAKSKLPDTRFEEHESGPELLVYLAVTTAGLTLAKSVVELITTIIKARSEGVKKGDKPSAPLVLIIRGYSKAGDYFEERALEISPHQVVTPKQIEDAIAASPPKPKKTQRKKK